MGLQVTKLGLVDVPVRHADQVFSSCVDLVPTAAARCSCGGLMVREVLRQDALFRGGGYGGTQRVDSDVCHGCGTTRVVNVQNERPPRV